MGNQSKSTISLYLHFLLRIDSIDNRKKPIWKGLHLNFLSGFENFELNKSQLVQIEKEKPKKIEKQKEVKKKIEKKPQKKEEQKQVKKPEPKKEKSPSQVTELVLPNLNIKTETVLSLFEDVEYDLKTVRYQKRVKPIYFTQFPKDLDEIKDTKLKKETFIKIVLPLVVAENDKILDDKRTFFLSISVSTNIHFFLFESNCFFAWIIGIYLMLRRDGMLFDRRFNSFTKGILERRSDNAEDVWVR